MRGQVSERTPFTAANGGLLIRAGRPKGSRNRSRHKRAVNFAQAKALAILQQKVLSPEGGREDRFSVLWKRVLASPDNDRLMADGLKFLTVCAFGRPPEAAKVEETTASAQKTQFADIELTEEEWTKKHGPKFEDKKPD